MHSLSHVDAQNRWRIHSYNGNFNSEGRLIFDAVADVPCEQAFGTADAALY